MSWVNHHVGKAAVFALTIGLAGCSTTPDPEDQAAAAREQQEQARQEALQQDFTAAVRAMEAGNREAARQQFEDIHQAHPQRTGPLANLGVLALQAGERAEAEAQFQAVVALDPGHTAALNYLGVIARENGEFEKAEARYRDALAADPDYLPAMMNLAILLDIYLGRPGEALPLYEEYRTKAEDPDPRLKDWIFDARNRI
jgi:Tfp pilus assembly protein PilF